MTVWERWVRQPQRLWLRRALFQVHLWTGIGVGLYIVVVCVTGSVLVYRNELYRAVTPRPILVVDCLAIAAAVVLAHSPLGGVAHAMPDASQPVLGQAANVHTVTEDTKRG